MSTVHPDWAEQLGHLVRFLNSDHGPSPDPLATLGSCRFWLADRGHPDPRAGLEACEVLRELRATLRRAVADGSASSARPLNDLIGRITSGLRFTRGRDGTLGWSLDAPPGAPRYAAELVATVARAMDDQSWARVRICAGLGCGLAFVDTTRAGRRTWCSMARCGNRAKQARWRGAHPGPARTNPARVGASG